MRLRDLGRAETRDGDVIEQAILRQIALLWQTRPLRRERLYVADEVEIALAYLRDMFLPVLPALYARWERALAASSPELPAPRQLDRRRSRRQSQRHRRLAAPRVEARVAGGARRPISSSCTRSARSCRSRPSWPTPTEAVAALADAQRRRQRRRGATSRIAARSPASMRGSPRPIERITGQAAPRPPSVAGEPTTAPSEFRADLVAIAHSLGAAGAGLLATGGALGRLIRAVDTFGFHLATLDLRQNADVHARVVADLLKVAGVEADYLALDEAARVVAAAPRARQRAAAGEPVRRLFGRDRVGAGDRARRRRGACALRAGVHHRPTSSPSARACPTCSRSTSCSRRRACTGRAHAGRRADHGGAAVRDDRRSRECAARSCAAGSRCRRSRPRRERAAIRK